MNKLTIYGSLTFRAFFEIAPVSRSAAFEPSPALKRRGRSEFNPQSRRRRLNGAANKSQPSLPNAQPSPPRLGSPVAPLPALKRRAKFKRRAASEPDFSHDIDSAKHPWRKNLQECRAQGA